ncbi:MAG: Gfo/Idh/MocA family oxidoreductase [Clostridia bacterium]|nr:Gfo/Idh/MocA family oxidoreductase [Clostridia bacterium]MBQ4085859.1 Gfo/Idh/MocA family oxidoreductase [Clostridia bacterium]
MLRVCVIGMGHIGNLHARIYKEDELVELCAVCDIIHERADEAAAKLGVKAYYDAPTMLREVKPDLVSVATGGYEYSSDHCLPTIQALEAGCHVLCEKPISNSIEDGQRMVDTARKMDRCFALDFNHRFTDAARAAKRWQNEGLIGDLLFCNMALWIGKPQDFESPYYHLKALNPHSCEIIRYFMGPVEAVQCFAMKAPGRTIWSTASINMKFKNGAVGHLTSSYDIARGHPMERCEVAGTKGRLVFEDMWREATLYPAGNPEKRVYTNPVFGGFANFDDTFRDRIRSFVRQVASGARPDQIDGSGQQGLDAQKVIHAAIESLDTGRIVYLDEMFPEKM